MDIVIIVPYILLAAKLNQIRNAPIESCEFPVAPFDLRVLTFF